VPKASRTFENLDEDKRKRVLDASMEEFAEHGFHQASVNRIVDRLGIAKGSIFKYFGTKEGLFRYVFERGVEVFGRRLRAVREATADADFFARLRAALMAGVEFIEAHPAVYRIYLKMLFQERFPLRETILAEVRAHSARYLTPMVEDAMRGGRLRPDLDVPAAVFVLDAVLDRFLQARAVEFMDAGLGLAGTDRAGLERAADACLAVLRAGLAGMGNGPAARNESQSTTATNAADVAENGQDGAC
jgi:AcrR family transcriptional regulator